MTDYKIVLEYTIKEFNNLKRNIEQTIGNHGYFPLRQLKDTPIVSGQPVTLVVSPEQYNGFKNALASLKSYEMVDSFTLLSDKGDPQLEVIIQQMQADRDAMMKANAEAQLGIGQLTEVTAKDVAKAKAKRKTSAKAKTRKRA